jgi:hypothetical protein
MSDTRDRNIALAFGRLTKGNTLTQAIGGASATKSGLTASAHYRIIADTDCFIDCDGGTADATCAFLPAGVPEVIATDETHTSLSVIQKAAVGTLWLTKLVNGKAKT